MGTMDNSTATTIVAIATTASVSPLAASHGSDISLLVVVSCTFTCLVSLYVVMLQIGYKLLRSATCMVRISLLSMLCVTEISYVAGIRITDIQGLCTAIAVIFHMSCISTFTWLLSYILFIGNNLKRSYHSLSAGIYVVLGFGVSPCFVLIALVWRYRSYRQSLSCWISSEDHLDWTLKGPIIAILVISAVLLVYVIRMYRAIEDPKQEVRVTPFKMDLIGCVVLLPVLGFTWLIGVFAATDNVTWMSAVFSVSNVILGLVVLVCMCFFNAELKHARQKYGSTYKALRERLKRPDTQRGRRNRATSTHVLIRGHQQVPEDRQSTGGIERPTSYTMSTTDDVTSTETTQDTIPEMFDNPMLETIPEGDDCIHVEPRNQPDLDSTDLPLETLKGKDEKSASEIVYIDEEKTKL